MDLRDARDQIERDRPDLRGDAKIKAIRDLRRSDLPRRQPAEVHPPVWGFVMLALILIGFATWLLVSGHHTGGVLYVAALVCLVRATRGGRKPHKAV